QLAAMVRHRSLVMIFSDLLTDDADAVLKSLHHLKHRGNDVILFHVLDAAEVDFPFHGMVEFEDKETPEKMLVDSDGMRADYLESLGEFRARYKRDCTAAGVDYVPLHTGMAFDKALMEYLTDRQKRF
ncbi:MAG: DUF58 domain-containing protein, partial [Planctomycetia bacterium]